MAMPLATAKQKISDLSYEYIEHVMKCVVFQDTTQDLFHWEQEIASFIAQVNNIIVKPDSKKLSSSYYRDYFFLGQGDELEDMRLFISMWKRREGKYYPSFEVTESLCGRLLEVCTDLADYFSPLVSKKNTYSKAYLLSKIVEYFED